MAGPLRLPSGTHSAHNRIQRIRGPGPSACRPAPTRHIIASSALEQVFGHLKDELCRGGDWETFEESRADLEAYIRHWNHVRRQARLKGLAPAEFRDFALQETA